MLSSDIFKQRRILGNHSCFFACYSLFRLKKKLGDVYSSLSSYLFHLSITAQQTFIHPLLTLYVISRHIQIDEIQIFVCRFSVLFLFKWKKKWNSVCRDLLNVSYKICSCGGVCMLAHFLYLNDHHGSHQFDLYLKSMLNCKILGAFYIYLCVLTK